MDNTFVTRLERPPGRRQWLTDGARSKLKMNLWVSSRPCTRGYGNVEARVNVFHLVSQTVAYAVPGGLVEVGCVIGDASTVIQMVASASNDRSATRPSCGHEMSTRCRQWRCSGPLPTAGASGSPNSPGHPHWLFDITPTARYHWLMPDVFARIALIDCAIAQSGARAITTTRTTTTGTRWRMRLGVVD